MPTVTWTDQEKRAFARRAAIPIALFVLSSVAVWLRYEARTGHPPTPSPGPVPAEPSAMPECDRACVLSRLRVVRESCANPHDRGGEIAADHAIRALRAGNCAEAERGMARVPGRWDTPPGVDSGELRLSAALALGRLCKDHKTRRIFESHLQLVHVDRSGKSTVEEIPDLDDTPDEVPEALWAGNDGTVVVVTRTIQRDDAPVGQRFFVRLREGNGKYQKLLSEPRAFGALLAGDDRQTFYVAQRDGIWHLENGHLVPVPHDPIAIDAIAVHEGRLSIAGRVARVPEVRRWDGQRWSTEALPAAEEPVSMRFVAGWLRAGKSLYARSLKGTWAEIAPPAPNTEYSALAALPGGGLVVGTYETNRIFRRDGERWAALGTLDATPTFLAARAPTDVVVATKTALLHYEGSRFVPAGYEGETTAVTLGPAEVLVLRQTE